MKNKPSSPAETGHFPFAGLFFLFLVLFGLQCWSMKENITRNSNLRETRGQLQNILPQAQNIQDNLSQLSQEILTFSKTNAEAQKIVSEFKIQFNPNAK